MNINNLLKQATQGPMEVYQLKHNNPSQKPYDAQIRNSQGNIIMVPSRYGEHGGAPLGGEEKIANCRLFAHCRNNFMEAVKGLKFAQRELDLLYAHAINTGIPEAGQPPHRAVEKLIKKLEEVE